MPLIESFSGVRGIFNDGIDKQVAIRYSQAYLSLLQEKNNNRIKIVIGTDTRPSREILKNSIIESLIYEYECEIIDIGIAPTQLVEFAVRYYNADGGIIITASHNEPNWNGFKFLSNNGGVLSPKDMDKVINNYSKIKSTSNEDNERFSEKHLNENSNLEKNEEIQKKYSDFVLGFLSQEDKDKIRSSSMKIIIDPNGGTGDLSKQILEELGVEVKGINMERGVFNRIVEPNEESLSYLKNEINEGNYSFAAGFDCDGDRVEILTKNGLLSGNELIALIGDDILSNSSNKSIVVNDATSSIVKEIAKKHNAEYIETQVGETNVVNKIYEINAPIGGEGSSSGVIIPPSRCRDGILTLVLFVKLLAYKEKNMSDLISSIPKSYYLKRKINLESKDYEKISEKLVEYYTKKDFEVKHTQSGSLKVIINDKSFIWFRVSKTEQNMLRIISDSPQEDLAISLINEATDLIKSIL